MFRFPPIAQVDPAEEKRLTRDYVKKNVFTFVALCVAVRMGDFLLLFNFL